MQTWLLNVGVIAAIVGGVVHAFPNILTPLVNKRLFGIGSFPVTLQRIVGFTAAIVLALFLFR